MRLLFAEDDPDLSRAVSVLLEHAGYSVDPVLNGTDAYDYALGGGYDGIILDWMMPGKDGVRVLKELRAAGIDVPCLMLTARDATEDRISGLDAGADDYLPKPFATQEFLARVKALARRNAGYVGDALTFGNVRLDCSCYELSCGEKTVRLNNKEFQLLELFFRHPRIVFSTEHIMDKLWDLESSAGVEVVWTYIGFIRKKLKEVQADVEIRTIRGAGYSLEEITC